jgi:hypothetical protein
MKRKSKITHLTSHQSAVISPLNMSRKSIFSNKGDKPDPDAQPSFQLDDNIEDTRLLINE